MIGAPIYYHGGYKYILSRDWREDLNLFKPFPRLLDRDIVTPYIELNRDGLLALRYRYAWDGCSGPTIDDPSNMRPGLVHDAGYQLLRMGHLPWAYRAYFDALLELIGLADGMLPLRAWYYRQAVSRFAAHSAAVGHDPYPEQYAPRPIPPWEPPCGDA